MALRTSSTPGPRIAAVLLLLAGSAGSGVAQTVSDLSSGLSSDDLSVLRGGYGTPPTDEDLAMLLPQARQQPLPQPSPQSPVTTVSVTPPDQDGQTGEAYPDYQSPPLNLGHAPDPLAPPFATEVSLALRGSFVHSAGSERFQVTATPRLGLTHTGTRHAFSFTTEAELTQVIAGEFLPSTATASADYNYRLDNDTALALNGALTYSRQSVNDPTLDPAIALPPIVLTGSAGAGVSRQLGKFGLGLSGDVSRTINGDTTLVGGTVQSNAESNSTSYGGGLRASFELTPILTLFGEGDAHYAMYDAASTTLGAKTDGWVYALRGGLQADWSGGFSGEASVGYGWRMFDAGTIASEEAILYGASLTYAPGGGFSATAGFTTQFSTPPSGSTYATQVEYAADGSVAYQINRVTTLRASLGWSRTQPSGSASYTQTWSAGTGADFVLSDFTSLSADYSFDRNEGDATTTTDSHTISAGVTISN